MGEKSSRSATWLPSYVPLRVICGARELASLLPSAGVRRDFASREGFGRCSGHPQDLMIRVLPQTRGLQIVEARAPRTTSSFSPYL
jgi:hypothetical protein